jgi:hypothetical protein
VSFDFIKSLPKNAESMLNYLKMCITLAQNNRSIIQLVDWGAIDKMMVSNTNGKAA